MKVAVLGLWHLGSVTAACAAAAGVRVMGIDDEERVRALSRAEAPVYEAGLDHLIRSGLDAGNLSFTADIGQTTDADVVWICHDTPVDDDDRADVAFVVRRIEATFAHLKDGAIVLVSAQLPVGSVRSLEIVFARHARGRSVSFACSPENLRLGRAIDAFQNPGRIIVGVRDQRSRAVLEPLLGLFCKSLIWMSVESAEMVKHALNSYLAVSVVVANEIARISELVGADAAEVEAGLRSDPRIGAKAYVRPGPAFAGGTLARDINFLGDLARKNGATVPVIDSVLSSNRIQDQWMLMQLRRHFKTLKDRTVAVLGLAYKPGTDTLRRSTSIELIRSLLQEGIRVRAFDPQVKALPHDLSEQVVLAGDARSATTGADALVVATECPEFRNLSAADVAAEMAGRIVLDPGRFLSPEFASEPRLSLISVGRAP